METELHVAQHSRREKLRVQNISSGEIYTTHFDQEGSHLNSDFTHLRSFRYGNMPYEPLVFPSPEAVNFGLDCKDVSAMMMHQGSVDSSAKASSGVPQSCSTWRSIAGGHGSLDSDWIADGNSNPGFVGQGLGSSLKSNYNQAAAAASSAMYGMKPSFQDYNASTQYHHNPMVTHQEMGYVAVSQQNNREGSSVSWANGGNGNELVLLPSYADRDDQHCDSINRQVDERYHLDERYHRWNGGLQIYSENKNGDRDGSNTQALSLSLSSIPLCNNRMVPQNLHSGSAGGGYGNMINNQDVKIMKSVQLCFDVKGSCHNGKGIEGHNNDQHNEVGNSSLVTSRSVGPLGPFTGYATILKSSRFLKPAQQLLDEFCNMLGPKSMKIIHLESPDHKLSSQTNRNDSNDMNATDSVNAGGVFGGDSGGSSSTFYSSNNNTNSEKVPEFGGLSSSTHESYRPEFLQKKAKLLYMLEEVCRRYKQYNQQMQMVVSAFETVAGLSAATPYISQALKLISRHFRCLRTAISDQLKSVRKALGEDLLSPTTGASCSSKGGDTSISSRLKLMDQALHINQKAPGGGGNMGFFEAQQHVWRPQRGLPERAVAILRAWLFDHFLHPYPTDADKHMLATQTGLSRNQVSNWFINARVRVWKPMVEEIHMLETKGSPETNSTVGNTDIKANHGAVGVTNDHIQSSTNRLMNTGGFTEKQVEYPGIGSSGFGATRPNMDDWNLKRSRVECHTGPGGTSMDGSLAGFAPYQQSGIDIGSLGAVSLTLGLRRNADGVQQPRHHHHHAFQQQQLNQQPHDHNQLRRHYGDRIIYDFVG